MAIETRSISPHSRIFPDGSRMPTFEGMQHTREQRSKMREALLGRPKPQELVIKQSRIYRIILPFLLRDRLITNNELVRWTGLTFNQVKGAVDERNRPAWHAIPAFTQEEQKKRRKRASAPGQPRRLANRKPLPQQEAKNDMFVRLLGQNGFFTNDLTSWNILKELYEDRDMTFSEGSPIRFIYEAFITAVTQKKDGNEGMLDLFNKLRKSMDVNWSSSLTSDLKLISHSIINPSEIDLELWNIAQAGGLFPKMIKEGLISRQDMVRLKRFFKGKGREQPEGLLNKLSIGVAKFS